MRTLNALVVLSLPLFWSLFSACAADVKYGSDNTQFGVGQQFVEGDGCTIASLPSSGCLDYGEIKMQTYDTCQQAGLQLVAISVKTVDGCDNATEGAVDYQCCPAPPPPPPPDYSN